MQRKINTRRIVYIIVVIAFIGFAIYLDLKSTSDTHKGAFDNVGPAPTLKTTTTVNSNI
jgi:hypothetical protein